MTRSPLPRPYLASDPVAPLRAWARRVILWLLWLLPPGLGWLAARGGMAWELVTMLGVAVAMAATLGNHASVPGARRRLFLAGGVAVAAALLLGAGHMVLSGWVAGVLPMAVLALAAGLCDPRALGLALVVLLLESLLPLAVVREAGSGLGLAGVLAVEAVALLVGQHLLRRAARRPMVLPPGRTGRGGRPAPAWSATAASAPPPVLVQAERTPEGTLRLAVASRSTGSLRVTVC